MRFGTTSAFSGEFLVVEEEKTYCSDQEALCIETLNWNKRFEKQNASDIYFNVIDDCPLHNSLFGQHESLNSIQCG